MGEKSSFPTSSRASLGGIRPGEQTVATIVVGISALLLIAAVALHLVAGVLS